MFRNLKDVSVNIISSINYSFIQTFLTIVNFGFNTARPPGGSLGAPVTNWQKARCCSGVNSPIISRNYERHKRTYEDHVFHNRIYEHHASINHAILKLWKKELTLTIAGLLAVYP